MASRAFHPGPHAALVGEADPSLRALLDEVLGEMGIALDAWPRGLVPDAVLAPVAAADAREVIGAARSLAGRAPIVAILALRDESLAALATACGAAACYSMDTPLDRLRAILTAVLDR